MLPQLGKIYDAAKLERAGGQDAFDALVPGSPEMQQALAHASEVSFQAVAVIPVILFFFFVAVWFVERKRHGTISSDPMASEVTETAE